MTSGADQTDGCNTNKPVVVYMDGCFDIMHYGHANALRQAKALGDILVVGICPQREIVRNKGPPVMSDDERLTAVAAVKWVDRIITDVPYVLSQQFLDKLIHENDIDIIVHGDDPCFDASGDDAYKIVKAQGRFRTIKRTEGVSSTNIVARILNCTAIGSVGTQAMNCFTTSKDANLTHNMGSMLLTTRRLAQFAGLPRAPSAMDRVVYVDGTFDMFHPGHIETLRLARQLGDFLLVGVHDDSTVNQRKGGHFPIMDVYERTLMVSSCRYVDDVIIAAPWIITDDMISSMNISIVVHGSYHKDGKRRGQGSTSTFDPYRIVRKKGMVQEVHPVSDVTTEKIVQRVLKNCDAYSKRNKDKMVKEKDYISNHKCYVEEL